MQPPAMQSKESQREDVGDPVCWLDRVCPDCGRLSDGRYVDACPECGADLPT